MLSGEGGEIQSLREGGDSCRGKTIEIAASWLLRWFEQPVLSCGVCISVKFAELSERCDSTCGMASCTDVRGEKGTRDGRWNFKALIIC